MFSKAVCKSLVATLGLFTKPSVVNRLTFSTLNVVIDMLAATDVVVVIKALPLLSPPLDTSPVVITARVTSSTAFVVRESARVIGQTPEVPVRKIPVSRVLTVSV